VFPHVHDSETAYDAFKRWGRTLLAHTGPGPRLRRNGPGAHEVYQTSTIGALMDAVYDGDVTIGELLRHGDFGLGTFNGLDGEMVILDGVCYHLRADGSARIADDRDLTPFASVTRFAPDLTIRVESATDRAGLAARIDESLESENLIYAVRVTGTFDRIRTRTVMAQRRPYPPLAEAAAGQKETTFSDVNGTLAGYRMPDYEQGVTVAGYHLHFIDDARHRGGHAMDFRLERATIEVCVESELHLSLPRTSQFLAADLGTKDLGADIRRAEGG
jgi:acetolactate decarboxylase